MTRSETRARLAADRERLIDCMRSRGIAGGISFSPSWTCVRLHRWSHLCHARGHPLAARFLWQLNLWLTGADISPMCDLGPGLLVIHPFAVTITGNAGPGFTIEGWGGLGGGMSLDDVGAGPGVPMVGANVRLDRGAMVLGPVRIGDGVHVGAGCTVSRSLPAGAVVEPHAIRLRRAPA